MGLDMYLHKKYYVKNYDFQEASERHAIIIRKGGQLANIDTSKISSVETEVMYWRKANQVHRWFVENCQDGRDECQSSYVDTEQLQELLDNCKEILLDTSLAPVLMPPQPGFFYGNYEYNTWYWANILRTITGLAEILAVDDCGDFYYSSSW